MAKKKSYKKENPSSKDPRRVAFSVMALAAFGVACLMIFLFCGFNNEQGYPVYINEVLASNSSYPNQDGRCCDYIELYNSADYAIDISGFRLGDITGSNCYLFPDGTTIGAGGYLVLYCDGDVDESGYAPFGISRSGGEVIYLIGSNGAILDSILTIATDMDRPMVRNENGEMILSAIVTPGQDNQMDASGIQDIYNNGLSSVRISEISTSGNGYVIGLGIFCDWVELHNTGSEAVDLSGFSLSDNTGNAKFVFPQGTVIEADAYYIVYCSKDVEDAGIAPFGLSKLGGETVVLKNPLGLVVEIVDTFAMEQGSQILSSEDTWLTTDRVTPGYPNTDDGYHAFLRNIGAEEGVIRISEVMADSAAFYPDAQGDFSDWVEIYNSGDRAVNLEGWGLSDDPNEPHKWTFPAVMIEAGQRLVVYCSGKDTIIGDEIHTGFSLSSGGETLILSSYLGDVTHQVEFESAQTNKSFIFEDGVASVFDPTPGYPNNADGYEAFCAACVPSGPLAIWEVMVSNDTYLPQQLGKCYDWVEIRNISDKSVNLAEYSITDDADTPGMYVLPDKTLAPGECIVIILSGDSALATKNYDHAPFSLNAAQDELLLYRNGDTLVDCVYLCGIPQNMSYGRRNDIGGFYYMEPSPQNPNYAGYRLISNMPQSQFAPGVYTSDTGVQLTLDADGVIYYTTDGSEPTAASAMYTGPVTIDQTMVIRAISVETNKVPSSIYTATFIIGQDHDLPIVSLVTDPEGLWGTNGVYKNGDRDVKQIDLSANVAYTGTDGSFSRDCQLNMHGDTSLVAADKKSMKVSFGDVYGGPLLYDVFEDQEVTAFSSLILRASRESTYSTHLHDAFIASVASDYCDTVISMKYKYIALYLNGEYWGLYAIREHHSEEHYASYMNVPVDTVTMIRYTTDVKSDLSELFKYCKKYTLRQDSDYAWAQEIIDISSMTDWIILQAYMCNIDINNNMRYYYSTVDGLWRCALVDLDLGMSGSNAAFSEVLDAWHHGEIPTALFANEDYKDYAAKRLTYLLSGPMSDESMLARLEAMADSIYSEVEKDCERWNYPVSGWKKFYKEMVQFCDGRAEEMITKFCASAGFKNSQKEKYFGDLLN